MDEATLRAWWSHRQGLDGRLSGASPAAILEETGWARSVGGVGPYFTLFSRGGITREDADRAVEALEIHELPSARGCTYVLPACHFAMALKVGQNFTGEMKTAEKLGVTAKEIDKLCDAVLKALGKGPLDPAELRDVLGPAVRNLGEEGKKKGLATTLPVALEWLQSEGEIRRVPVNGRLDQQRYRYTLWRPNPLSGFKLSVDECLVSLARAFFGWIGPATMAEFQSFSAVGVKAIKNAVESLRLEPAEKGSERLLLPEHREAWEKFSTPKRPQYALVSSLDGLALLHRDLKDMLASADLDRKALTEKGACTLGSVAYLPSHAIVDRGRLVGLWEFDPANNSIVSVSFIGEDAALRKAVRETEQFVRDQLGDARSFSLDSPKSREPKIKALRAASAG
jgi:hypothetical protein